MVDGRSFTQRLADAFRMIRPDSGPTETYMPDADGAYRDIPEDRFQADAIDAPLPDRTLSGGPPVKYGRWA